MASSSSYRPFLSFSAIFFGVFLALYGLYKLAEPYIQYYFVWLADSVCLVTGLFDSQVSCQENVIYYAGVPSLQVVEGCDGITVFILIIAAVMAFPKPLKQRLLGVAVLVPILFAINWLRLLILADIRFYLPDMFRFVHVYLFQPMMVFATFLCFIIWILYNADQQSAH